MLQLLTTELEITTSSRRALRPLLFQQSTAYITMQFLCFSFILCLSYTPVWGSSESLCTSLGDANSDCDPFYREGCDCGCYQFGPQQEIRFLVNCTNKGFTNTSILQNLPSQAEVLIFTGNRIDQLPWNVLGTNRNNHLKVVDMSNNNLKEILGKSYHRVRSVERLILNHNELKINRGFGESNKHHPRIFSNFENLKELHLTNAFADYSPNELAVDLHDIFVQSNLTQLMKLHLEQNEIQGFKDPYIFCDLPSLMDVHLANNLLNHLDFDVECLHHLRYIDLEYNNITVMRTSDLKKMDLLPKRNQSIMIDISHNPVKCDCSLKDFLKWLDTTQVKVRNIETLMCASGYPATNKGALVKSLKNIQCMPSEYLHHSEPSEQLNISRSDVHITVLLGFLVCLLFILLGTLLYMNRVHLKYQLSPVLDSVSRKVQYTSIEKQKHEMDV